MKIISDRPIVLASFQPAAPRAACGRPGAGLPARPRWRPRSRPRSSRRPRPAPSAGARVRSPTRSRPYPAARTAPGQWPAIWPPPGEQDLTGYDRRRLGEHDAVDDAADVPHMPGWAQLRAEPCVAFRRMYLGPDDARWPSLADPNPRVAGCLIISSTGRTGSSTGWHWDHGRAAGCSLPAPGRLHTAWRLERDWACRRPLPVAPAVELAPA